ncbi:uncharacterized protein TRAVEDRAFT_123554 [Trametes versicolor FP-101664 SS1]|uniref:uncharacterized protein n=1 Tax=Trametes versicolor (strain FP-101664) TaxID=717944 RepID=UPI0004623E8E|nr:uncharacterized protein TRAVEDRAFT_123554 [Trametes versicolor FP-101664 SS1]EIW58305.1 hypothetical protein TRAVEDRAFT_123554 [Trametes versicolor FP-101664 SS1]
MSRRDPLFPAGSIGRSGLAIQRDTSHESLTAHPLLSPAPAISPSPSTSPSTAAVSTTVDTPLAGAVAPGPRYVPYTPRQRGAPSPATTTTTTGASMHPAAPPDRDAANRLQLMNLKAAAQKDGLDAASTGWLILEKFALEAERLPEWNEVWNAVVDGKATLLLPRDQHPANVSITPDFIKDHVAFCDASAASRTTSVTTLSGLRGSITENALTFRSTLSPASKPFQALLSPSTRASAYAALAPLPRPLSSSPTAHPYPSFAVHAHVANLPLPPRPAPHSKGPPLPPRPPVRPGISTQPAGSTSTAARLSNPFASLFGRANVSTPTPPASPTTGPLALPTESPATSPGLSTSPAGTPPVPSTEHSTPHNVPAYVISARIQRAQVLAGIANALKGELEDVLTSEGVPLWAREKVIAWSHFLAPVVPGKPAPVTGARRVSGLGPTGSPGRKASDTPTWEIAGDLTAAVVEGGTEEVARKMQEFWYELEDEVGKRWAEDVARERQKGRRWRRHPKAGSGSEGESERDKEEKETERDASEQQEKEGNTDEERDSPKSLHVTRVMDAVERVICSLFYDRLFLPPGSDDVSHDEALSSRIAAVNLLDLGLGHLGVEVGRATREVEALVKACGQTLMQLDSVCRAPADKAGVLVSVHKILVDGLSKLPPLRLRAEDEMADEKTPRASSFNRNQGSDDDDSDRAVSPPPAVIVSPDSESPAAELQPLAPSDHPGLLTPDNASANSDSIRTPSPILTVSPPPEAPSRPLSPVTTPTPVSGDIILPLLIFAVVKANPPHLVSHLLFTQRFRRERAAGGEEGYCLVNLMAVAEFLENVDLAALGLGESEKMVISTAELSPIPINRAGSESGSPRMPQASLRGRVEQQVDALAGSANKVLTGVVDTSFGVLRAFLPGQTSDTNPEGVATPPVDADQGAAPWNIAQPRFGLLRRDTHFSIASIAASLPGRSKSAPTEEAGQQMMDVPSRPGSSRSMLPEDGTTSEDEDEEDDEDDEEEEEEEEGHDTRSIRSFESMMSQRSRQARKRKAASASGRKTLADRLASVPGLSRLSQSAPGEPPKVRHFVMSPTGSRRSSLMVPPHGAGSSKQVESPVSSRPQSPIAIRISPPNSRFLNCSEDDIKVSEVGELLREYKRLVEAVRAAGGFHEE